MSAEELARSAVVFSPHFDDETLGCGGTVLKKKRAGARVRIVFMTDGSKSHKGWISEDALRRLRREEGLAAARCLGLETEDVILLGFEETRLQDHVEQAARRVLDILLRERPQDVFMPYHRDPPADHVATHRIVMSALRAYGGEVTVYEYPIWFWQHWPWTRPSGNSTPRLRRVVKHSLLCSLRLIREFRSRVCLADVAAAKRAALEQHRSQMSRLNNDPTWPILSDVSGGDFLRCFFGDHEVFRKRVVRAGG